MRVVAHKKGHYLVERQIGEEFEFPEDALKKDGEGKVVFPSWFAPASIAKPIIAAAKAKEEARYSGKKKDPRTRSEAAARSGNPDLGDIA